MIHAITYGPGWSELDTNGCNTLYGWTHDSTNWSADPEFPVWVHEDKYDNVGCAWGTPSGGDFLIGGNIGISASNSTYYASAVLDADQTNYGYLLHVPTSGTTIMLDASPWFWSGYEFLYWEISGGTWRRDTNPHLELPGDTDDYEFYAVFKHP